MNIEQRDIAWRLIAHALEPRLCQPEHGDHLNDRTEARSLAMCCCRHTDGGFHCTREKHHAGPHVAHGGKGNYLEVWK